MAMSTRIWLCMVMYFMCGNVRLCIVICISSF